MSDIVKLLDAIVNLDWRVGEPFQISDTVARARDIIKELRAHRDGLNADLARATLEAEALRLRVERLEEALRPFARHADGYVVKASDGHILNYIPSSHDYLPTFTITLGDCRAARAVLAEGK